MKEPKARFFRYEYEGTDKMVIEAGLILLDLDEDEMKECLAVLSTTPIGAAERKQHEKEMSTCK